MKVSKYVRVESSYRVNSDIDKHDNVAVGKRGLGPV